MIKMEKIVSVIIGSDCERTIELCLESVKDSDTIIFIDGGSSDSTPDKLNKFSESNSNLKVYMRPFIKENPNMIAEQRQFYLEILKKDYQDYFSLVLDADEVLHSFKDLRNYIEKYKELGDTYIFSPKMKHLMNNLGTEDATQPEHFVPCRLFKVSNDLEYPNGEHTVLRNKDPDFKYVNIRDVLIWHLAYVGGIWDVINRYSEQVKRGTGHSKQFLDNWYVSHLLGLYPTRKLDVLELPEFLLRYFGIDKDMLYFANRGQLETKHFLMIKEWIEGRKLYADVSFSIIDLGCGMGHFGKAAKTLYPEINYTGFDISEWAINNSPYKNELQLFKQDITQMTISPEASDLVLCIDILEHLQYTELETTLENISKLGYNFIFSIPFIGDPNLENDKTHIIKEEKEWWIEVLSKYFNIQEAPKDWSYHNQILVGQKLK